METNIKNTILVPVDFSDIANHALHHAAQVAKHFNNNLALLHVVEESILPSFLSFGKDNTATQGTASAIEAALQNVANDVKNKYGVECKVVPKKRRISQNPA
jgi:nucleotide-binding universal stress UspA family protein